MHVYCVDDVLTWRCSTSPERNLLGAVLDRALRDLDPTISTHVTRDAVAWFNSSEDPLNTLSYELIVDELELGTSFTKAIADKVRRAELRIYGSK